LLLTRTIRVVLLFGFTVAAVAVLAAAGGCQGPALMTAAGSAGAAGEQAVATTPPEKSGVQLWAETCGRCHNLRDPAWRSADAREVAVHHMRLRVPMTGEDQRAIQKFLRGD